MALLVTLFLVLVNIFNTVRSNAPIPASTSLNATDTYLVVSILMVFLALLEYAVVLLFMNVSTLKLGVVVVVQEFVYDNYIRTLPVSLETLLYL